MFAQGDILSRFHTVCLQWNDELHLFFLSSPGMDPGHRWEMRFRDEFVIVFWIAGESRP